MAKRNGNLKKEFLRAVENKVSAGYIGEKNTTSKDIIVVPLRQTQSMSPMQAIAADVL